MTSSPTVRRRALPVLAALLASPAFAQAPQSEFAAPVRLLAGEKHLGENRLFPSPVLHDYDGDGRLDVVVGDLRGHLTVALRLPGDGPPKFGAEAKIQGADGRPLDFANW